jgi:thiopeptide-type bacteriocin biosynthesis protein
VTPLAAQSDLPVVHSDFFVFRTALLPFDELLAWSSELEAPRFLDDPAAFERAWLSDRTRLRERLRAIVMRPEIREALFLASPDLDAAIDRSLENADSKKSERLERTLVRYFSRMCGRSTPFGLFAGYSVGRAAEKTRLQLQARGGYRRHTRLDMDYLSALIEAFASDPLIQGTLLFRPNTSLYRSAGRLRYFESHLVQKVRSYRLVAVEETPYLTETLRRAEGGTSVAELAQPLVDDEVTVDDATEYVRELVACQLLVPNLAPKATGPEPVHGLIADLRSYPATQAAADRLDEVRRSLEAMDGTPPGIDVDRYRNVAAQLEELPAAVELSRLIQVDMIKPADNATLGRDVIEEISRAIHLLRGLRPEPVEDDLSRFREAFRAHYDNREMPLFEVLDEENGIGFGLSPPTRTQEAPLLEGLALPQGRPDDRVRWSRFDAFLLDKLQETARSGADIMSLESETLGRFATGNAPPLPDSMAVVAKLAASSQEALDAGAFQVAFTGTQGPSGVSLLGRFCHGDAALLEHVQRHLLAEESQQPDAVFAEVVHLPEGRLGNVILRPTLRTHEIPFLGQTAVGAAFRIPVSDLMVSVSGQSVVLSSRGLGKRIIPRLTSAHNFRRGLGVYRFLCSLQFQGARVPGWGWGALDAMRFLPRVMVGRLVVSPARWRVDRSEMQPAIEARDAARYAHVQRWRQERRIPRFVLLADADNTLPFDLDNALSVETLVELVKKRHEFRLHELFPGPDELCAVGPEGRFVHELVIPLIMKRDTSATAAPATRIPADVSSLPRTFPPGSEWLFAKLYTGAAGSDQLLQEVVSPLVRKTLRDGSADGWFFIRYSDPDWHVRLRLHGDPRRLSGEVLPQLHAFAAPLLANGLVWKIELSTYEREIERYGHGEAMLSAERLFQIDSEAVLSMLADLSGEELADHRWQAALRGVDQMLDDLGFDLKGKIDVLSGARSSLMTELNAPPAVEHQLGDRFRKERRSLEALLDRATDVSSPIASALSALHVRSEQLRPIVASLRGMAQTGRLSRSLESLAVSYIHMHTNRILRAAGKAQELVIYDFLVRLYQSQSARAATRDHGEVGARSGNPT